MEALVFKETFIINTSQYYYGKLVYLENMHLTYLFYPFRSLFPDSNGNMEDDLDISYMIWIIDEVLNDLHYSVAMRDYQYEKATFTKNGQLGKAKLSVFLAEECDITFYLNVCDGLDGFYDTGEMVTFDFHKGTVTIKNIIL